MVQRRKDSVRRRILDAATTELRERGFHGAKMAAIAARADLSTGNVYRYFDGKHGLYDAVIDAAFVERFEGLLDARVDALAALTDLRALGPDARARQDAFLDFLVAERERVIILLDRSEGTGNESFARRFVERLVARTFADLRTRGEPAPHVEPLLHSLFDGTRRTIVAILEAHREPEPIRAAFTTFWSFQLAGLAGLREEVTP